MSLLIKDLLEITGGSKHTLYDLLKDKEYGKYFTPIKKGKRTTYKTDLSFSQIRDKWAEYKHRNLSSRKNVGRKKK